MYGNYENNYSNNEYTKKSFNIFNTPFLRIIAVICYLILIGTALIQFIPINNLNWFNLGMGKLVGLSAIFGILCILNKNYFAAFFISLFSAFFAFHEIIIFYDNYAIELGQEIGDDGVFRSLYEIFKDEIFSKPQFGAFWAIMSSSISLFTISIDWIINTIIVNHSVSEN